MLIIIIINIENSCAANFLVLQHRILWLIKSFVKNIL